MATPDICYSHKACEAAADVLLAKDELDIMGANANPTDLEVVDLAIREDDFEEACRYLDTQPFVPAATARCMGCALNAAEFVFPPANPGESDSIM